MQNVTILSQLENARESEIRRASVVTSLLALGLIAVAIAGILAIVCLGSRLGFYAAVAVGAALTDPLRRNLAQALQS